MDGAAGEKDDVALRVTFDPRLKLEFHGSRVTSRFVHLAVKDDETTASAVAFLKEAVRAFPFQDTHVLTDRGSCFVADAFEAACRKLRVEHRTTRPYTPRTNGMVERFNGRVQREVLGITIHSHHDLEVLLRGFNRAYNARRQRVLGGASPDQAV